MKIIRIGLASFFILTLIFSALSIGPLFADELTIKSNENYKIEVSADQQAFKPILSATQTTGPISDLYYFNWYSNYRYFIRRA